MTTLHKAARQALWALEAMQSYAAAERKGLRICDEAITALRAALAQQEGGGGNLPPPLQAEPVAWKLWDENPEGGGDWRYYDAKDFKEGIDPMKYFDGLVPLYFAPPQRKPLTEEEIGRICDAHWSLRQLARAIERAHGIGEQP